MPAHPLTPLFAPRSVAIVGASARPGRPGRLALDSIAAIGFKGSVYPVTPSYPTIGPHACYPVIAALPMPVDLAVLAGAADRLEADATQALKGGARALVAFAQASVEQAERVTALAREAGAPLLGPNSIGFVNYARGSAGTWSVPARCDTGGISLVIQSGSTYAFANSIEPRARFSLTAHPGQEMGVTVAAIADYALSLPDTRVLGLFLETIRDPEAFDAMLAAAAARNVAVVALKVGRTESGARHVVSHAGRLAGGEAAFTALCRRHGVVRVEDMDEWWATLLLLGALPDLGPGGLVAITDSGGQRALLADHAEDIGLVWADIGEATRGNLAACLPSDFPPVNPLDAWAGQPNWIDVFADCLTAMVGDPAAAVGVVVTEFGAATTDPLPQGMAEVCRRVARGASKPIVATTFTSRQFHPEVMLALAADGVVVLDGGFTALKALKHALDHRDAALHGPDPPPPAPSDFILDGWRSRLGIGILFDEAEGLRLLADFGIAVTAFGFAAGAEEAAVVAAAIGFPVALKTAMGIAHKTEADGVRLGLYDATTVAAAYADLAHRLGPRVLVQAMATKGAEVAFGLVRDPQFGAIVMASAGGELVEVLRDVAFALPPFGPATARRLLGELGIAKVLAGVRGRPPVDWNALADALARFSVLAASLGDGIAEADVNPLVAGPHGVVAVDALIRPASGTGG